MKCIVCGRDELQVHKLYFFPSNKDKFNVWFTNMNLPEMTCTLSTFMRRRRICDLHFLPIHFQHVQTFRLNSNAIPTLHPCTEPPTTSSQFPASVATSTSVSDSTISQPQPSTSGAPPSSTVPSFRRKRKFHFNTINEVGSVPRKKAFVYIIRKKDDQIEALKKLCENRRRNLMSLSQIGVSPILKKILQDMSMEVSSFIVSQFRCAARPWHGRKWTLDEEILSLPMYIRSPRCYSLLRSVVALPSKRALDSLLHSLSFNPGINAHLFEHLKECVDDWSQSDRMCVLMFDEMNIKEHIQYDWSSDSIVGLQDHGNGRVVNSHANHALVFMIQGVTKKWKQPVAYYFNNRPASALQLQSLLLEVIDALRGSNIQVVATVCNSSTANVKTYKSLGCSADHPFFYRHSQPIFTLFDPPYLLESTRRLFQKYPVEVSVPTGDSSVPMEAQWRDIEDAFTIDQKSPSIFRFLYKVTDAHIKVTAQRSAKVELAAQTFSQKTASYLYILLSTNRIRRDSIGTAYFVQQVDELFDSLNGSRPFDPDSGKPLRCCLTRKSPHVEYWANVYKTVYQWRFVGIQTKNRQHWRPPTQMGWLQTIQGMRGLWKQVQRQGVLSIRPRSFNLDVLENLFGNIRSGCGCSDNPTAQQFVNSLKTQIVNNLTLCYLQGRNREEDDARILSNLRSFLEIGVNEGVGESENLISEGTSVSRTVNEAHIASEIAKAVSAGYVGSLSVAYVSNLIIKKYFDKISCEHCSQLLTSDSFLMRNQFISNKDYSTDDSRLFYPSEKLVTAVGRGVYQLEYKLPSLRHTRGIRMQATTILKNTLDFSWITCPIHLDLIRECVVGGIVGIGIPWYCTRVVRRLKSRIRDDASKNE